MYLIKGSPNHTLAVINAHKDYYKKIPKKLKKRIQLKKNKSENFNANGVYTGSILWARYFKGVLKYSNLNHRLFKR